MAHFAELDNNGKVLRVVVVGNDISANGGTLETNDMHIDGEKWCADFFKGGTWKQTSYSSSFRKQYAGVDYTYDIAKDKFIEPQPFTSWALDANDSWQAPVTYPTILTYESPSGVVYVEGDKDPQNSFNWDASALAWVSA